MPYQQSDYKGDAAHPINATGDVVVGDHVAFERARFTGSYKSPSFAGFERVEGEVIADSYGAAKQQHTFTLLRPDGSKIRIKGRNLYANGVWRKPWTDEKVRAAAQDEKHQRGDKARAARAIRRTEAGLC